MLFSLGNSIINLWHFSTKPIEILKDVLDILCYNINLSTKDIVKSVTHSIFIISTA